MPSSSGASEKLALPAGGATLPRLSAIIGTASWLAEHRVDLVATQRADHEIGAFGDGIPIGGHRAAGSAGGVVEHDLGATTMLAVVAGEEAIAHRRGGGGEAAGQRQQHRQLRGGR